MRFGYSTCRKAARPLLIGGEPRATGARTPTNARFRASDDRAGAAEFERETAIEAAEE